MLVKRYNLVAVRLSGSLNLYVRGVLTGYKPPKTLIRLEELDTNKL